MRSKISVAVLDDYQNVAASFADWNNLGPDVDVVFFQDHVADKPALLARLKNFDAVVLTRERTIVDRSIMSSLPNLKFIASVGMWNAAIDLQAAAERGIVVSGTETFHPNGTPALTWGLILGLLRGIHREASSVEAGGWQRGVGIDTAGRTLGVLGLGKIGQVVAKIGMVFGMNVIAWSQNLKPDVAASHGVTWVSKEELFRRSDVLTIHLKLSDRTRAIVGDEQLQLMKPTSYLINTSRGPLVSEAALVEALQRNRIAGAGLDVFDQEPLPADHPFRYLPNVLATPHIGYVTEDTYRDAFPQIVDNIKAWLEGAPCRALTA